MSLRLLLLIPLVVTAQTYYPGLHEDWERSTAGFQTGKLQEAIAFAQSKESQTPRDLRLSHDLSFGRELYGEPLGPFRPRSAMTGLILHAGKIVAEWGEPERVDMTFSVTKSFVSTTVGLAVQDHLIHSTSDPVRRYVATGEFEGPLNAKITWDHLLRQTSDWEGTLWGKPDWADRPPKGDEVMAYRARRHREPGTSYKYNDVRVNLLAYAALQVWRRPLPQVLKERIMDPIGASSTWRWYGYENSWVELDGMKMQSVAGGGHWGGGMMISARDMARFGLLTLRNGRWKGKALLAEEWVRQARTPTPVEPTYGYMNWYLNTNKKLWPSAPAAAWAHVGNGTNLIYCDPEHDLVVVLRWIEGKAVDGVLQRIFGAMGQ
ncbi:MAG TPA: serine hydrolase [Bryobacteraceae bacterium]|nr:serine hydrolase [Bryobacteraceae bacterium]